MEHVSRYQCQSWCVCAQRTALRVQRVHCTVRHFCVALLLSIIAVTTSSQAAEVACNELGIVAIDTAQAKKLLEARRLPSLGARKCLLVAQVDPAGPLARVVEPGFAVTEINGHSATTLTALSDLAATLRPGDKVTIGGYILTPVPGKKPQWTESEVTVVLQPQAVVAAEKENDSAFPGNSGDDIAMEMSRVKGAIDEVLRGLPAGVGNAPTKPSQRMGGARHSDGVVRPLPAGESPLQGAAVPRTADAGMRQTPKEVSSGGSTEPREQADESQPDAASAIGTRRRKPVSADAQGSPSDTARGGPGSAADVPARKLTVSLQKDSEIKIPQQAGWITCMSFSADHKWLAVGIGGPNLSGHVVVLASETLEQVFATPSTRRDYFKAKGGVAAIAINDERQVMWATADGEITLVDAKTKQLLANVPVHESQGGGPCAITYCSTKNMWCVANIHGLGTISRDGKKTHVVVKGVTSPFGDVTNPRMVKQVGISPGGDSACWWWVVELNSQEFLVGYACGLDGEKQCVFKDDYRPLTQLQAVAYRGEEAVLVGTSVGVFQGNVRTPGPLTVVAPVHDGVLECVAGCIEPPLTVAVGSGGTLFVQYGFAKDRDGVDSGCLSWSDSMGDVKPYGCIAVSRDGCCLAAAHGDSGIRVFSVDIK